MNQTNTLFDLVERITDLLQNGRVEVVYNVAKKPELSPRLRDTFIKLADFVTKKNNEIEAAARVNTFYRECIQKILDMQQFDQQSLSNEYGQISKESISNIMKLKEFIQSVFKQIHEHQEQGKSYLQELEKKFEAEQSFTQQISQIHEQEDKNLERIQTLIKQNQQLSRFVKQENEQKEKMKQLLNQLRQQNQILQGDLQVRKQMVKRLTQEVNDKKSQQKKKIELEMQLHSSRNKIEQLKEAQRQLDSLREQFEQRNDDIQKLQKDLSQKMDQIMNLKKEKGQFQSQINQLQQQLKQTTQKINQLTEQHNQLQSINSSKIFINESLYSSGSLQVSIFQKFNNQYKLADPLVARVQKLKGKPINGIQRVYNFKQFKKQSFHTFIANKSNILLVCSTQDGSLVGGFTSASFSLDSESSDTKAFLFGLYRQDVSFSQLKRGKASVEYDPDFLIFGNEELCIERGKCEISSYSSKLESQEKHYECSARQDYLQSLLGRQGKLVLKNYQIFELNFDG